MTAGNRLGEDEFGADGQMGAMRRQQSRRGEAAAYSPTSLLAYSAIATPELRALPLLLLRTMYSAPVSSF